MKKPNVYRLFARIAIVTWNGYFTALGVISVWAVAVDLTATDAEAVLGGFDLLYIEAAFVVGKNAE